MEKAAVAFKQLMLLIYIEFPELKSLPLYLTGESYAGKYVPYFAIAIN
jgi:carboxypeptidase C (cathepsin A)